MNPVIILAPSEVDSGFALAGARTRRCDDPADVPALVEAALAEGAPLVAVHHTLWGPVPSGVRTRWAERTDRLVLSLPPDDGVPLADRQAALHELLARAVGYEISFAPGSRP